jgi:hypothetical protein
MSVFRRRWGGRRPAGPDIAAMPTSHVRARAYPGLYEPATLRAVPAYAREVAPGLVELLTLDLPGAVASMDDAQVAAHGPYEPLRERAVANLRGLRPDRERRLRQGGVHFRVLHGRSRLTASLAEVVARYEAPPVAEDGVLVAFPDRRLLAFHAVRDASAVRSMLALADYAHHTHRDGAEKLTPCLYWWQAGQLQQVSLPGERRILMRVPVELGDVLDRMSQE